jgi:hypothetical protein
MKLDSSKSIQKNYFFSKYSVEYTLRVSTTPTVKAAFVSSCLNNLIPSAILTGGELANIKGREPEGSEKRDSSGTSGDLMLKLNGTYPRRGEENDEDEEQPEELIHEPWSVDSFSVFQEFQGSRDIIYECHPRSTLNDDTLADLGTFIALTDADVHHFELYLEFFSSRFISSLLGFAPVVLQKLSILASEDELRLVVSHEQLPSAKVFPLTQRQLREALQQLFEHYFFVDIVEDAESAETKS